MPLFSTITHSLPQPGVQVQSSPEILSPCPAHFSCLENAPTTSLSRIPDACRSGGAGAARAPLPVTSKQRSTRRSSSPAISAMPNPVPGCRKNASPTPCASSCLVTRKVGFHSSSSSSAHICPSDTAGCNLTSARGTGSRLIRTRAFREKQSVSWLLISSEPSARNLWPVLQSVEPSFKIGEWVGSKGG